MPRLPKWIANGMEKVFSHMIHPVTVTHTQYFDKALKLVRFEGDLSKTKFNPGNIIEFRVSDTDFRHYTPSFFDKNTGVCEVIFYLHQQGVGSHWAENLKPGHQTKLMGPGGKISFKNDSTYHYCWGDESSLGLAYCLQQVATRQQKNFKSLLELHLNHQHWTEKLGLHALVVGKSDTNPAQETIEYLNQVNQQTWQREWQPATFYLTGRAKSIQQFRNTLRQKGVSSQQILIEPYWADHKKGL